MPGMPVKVRLLGLRGFLLAELAFLGGLAPGAARAEETVILDESAYWRRYYRFGNDLVSPQALRAEGQKTLGPNRFDQIRTQTEDAIKKAGVDGYNVFRLSPVVLRQALKVGTARAAADNQAPPAGADWTEYVFLRLFNDPYTAPPPPDDWMSGSFDDGAWPIQRGTFQADMPNDLPASATSGNMAKIHVNALQFIGAGMQASYYRARFHLEDPVKSGDLTLGLTYRGGARVFVNGEEVVRGHLPGGVLAPDASGEDYPEAAYKDAGLRDRRIGPVKIPQRLLRKGDNVLAVEIRASHVHPILLSTPRSKSWNELHERESLWRHAHLSKLELRSASPAPSSVKRPAGVQVWVEDLHHRVRSDEFRPGGHSPGTVRVVGARNGTHSAQVVVGTDRALAGLRVSVSDLQRAGGTEKIPAAAVQVQYLRPFPADGFNEKLGDERGLDATFPNQAQLARHESLADPAKPHVFDHLAPVAPAGIPAGTCWPVWLSFRIPKDAAAGTYRGTAEVKTEGLEPISLPVEVEVADWCLPDPRRFQTFVGLDENPYGVAKQYGAALWSEEHFRLLEASFRQMGRAGNAWLTVPVLRRTEYGNKDDSIIKWVRRKDGALTYDYSVLDRYLDLAVKNWGAPKAVNFMIMHGHPLVMANPEVMVVDEGAAGPAAMQVGGTGLDGNAKSRIWRGFATALDAHLKSRSLGKSLCWGFPGDGEADPELRALIAGLLPDASWAAAPHQVLGTQGYAEKCYRIIGSVRYFRSRPDFRFDQGWKSQTAHLTIPRIDSSVISLSTASHPFAFRMLPGRSLAMGRSGFFKMGADEWATAHWDGMRIPTWVVGQPVLFLLWPGEDGAEPSARFEALVEGIQEAEARIFIERALDRDQVPQDVERRARAALTANLLETSFIQNKLCIYELEQYHYRWQERSRELYRAAAEVAGAGRGAGR